MSDPSLHPTSVSRFADALLASDLPRLSADRRRDAVEFVERRVDGLPSFTHLGVVVISRSVDLVGRLVGDDRVRTFVTTRPLPFVAEYPRLVRSLGYSYVWETWPDTAVDGAAA